MIKRSRMQFRLFRRTASGTLSWQTSHVAHRLWEVCEARAVLVLILRHWLALKIFLKKEKKKNMMLTFALMI